MEITGVRVENSCQVGLNMFSVQPYAQESKFWYSLWVSAGDLFLQMRHSKRQFKYAARRLKRCQNILQNDRFVKSLLQTNGNIFNEIRKYRGQNATFSTRIDEEVGAQNIATHFSDTYSQLYNKVKTDDQFPKTDFEVFKFLPKDM